MSGNKFSVVIPTMWYSDKTHRNLSNLNDCDAVGEIILIDNNTSLKPKYIDDLKKVKYLPQKENIYVNPAWNLGVRESVYTYICICNDDVIFNTDIFEFIRPHITSGVYGMWTGNYYGEGVNLPYEVKPIDYRPWGWGCLFFIYKANWVEIDERLKIACGDDWLIHHSKGGGYQIHNLDLGGDEISVTTRRGEFFGQQQEDIKLWESLY
jgi:hypothetical protein